MAWQKTGFLENNTYKPLQILLFSSLNTSSSNYTISVHPVGFLYNWLLKYLRRNDIVIKRFFDRDRYTFPTIFKLRYLNYIFRYLGIDDEIVAEIHQMPKAH